MAVPYFTLAKYTPGFLNIFGTLDRRFIFVKFVVNLRSFRA